MPVTPIDAGSATSPAASRDGPQPVPSPAPGTAVPESRNDALTVSPRRACRPASLPTARSCSARPSGSSEDAVPRDTLPPEQLRAVLDRLAGRFYDRAEVRERVAEQVTHDLHSTPE
jgi:hypothetical protein